MGANGDGALGQGVSSDDTSSKKQSRTQRVAGAVGSALSQAGRDLNDQAAAEASRVDSNSGAPTAARYSVPNLDLPQYKRGGTVRKTGVARLHRNERVKGNGRTDKKRTSGRR